MSVSPSSCRSPLGFNRKPRFRTHIFQLYQNVLLASNQEILEGGELFSLKLATHCSFLMSLMNYFGSRLRRPDCEEWKKIQKGKSLSYWFGLSVFFWDFWPNPKNQQQPQTLNDTPCLETFFSFGIGTNLLRKYQLLSLGLYIETPRFLWCCIISCFGGSKANCL